MWELIYEFLIKNKICSKSIAIIEDRYVESILSNNSLFTDDYKDLLPKIKSVIDMVGICIRIIEIASSVYNDNENIIFPVNKYFYCKKM